MIQHIFLESLRIRKKENIFLIIQCILMFVLVISLVNISGTSLGKVKQLNQTAISLHKLTDNFILKEENKFFSQSDNVLLLKKFYEWEKSNSLWNYIIASRQNVGTIDMELNEIFEYGYEVRQRTEGTYKSIQINDNFLEHFSLNVYAGRKFYQDDYIYNGGILPILLGNGYNGIFDIHDKVNLYYLGEEFDCEVVGILEPNSYYNNGYNLELLDYYIILPSIERYTSPTKSHDRIKKFELKLYLDKCAGYVVSNVNSNILQNQISKKCYEVDLIPYSLEGLSNYYPTMWGLEGKQLGKILSYFVAIILIGSILCISLNMTSKVSMLTKIYVIFIMNGVRKIEIMRAIILEIAFVAFVSVILAATISFSFWGQIPILTLILCYLFVCFLSSIYPWQMLRKIKLSLIVNEQES